MASLSVNFSPFNHAVTSVTKRDKSRNVTGRDSVTKRDTPKGVVSRLSRHSLSHLSRRSHCPGGCPDDLK